MRIHVGFLQAFIGMVLMFFVTSTLPAVEPKCACKDDIADHQPVWSTLRSGLSDTSPELAAMPDSPRLLKNASVIDADGVPLHVFVPEGLLNRLLATERTENGQVRDVIANTDVIGRQTTVTRIQVDCRPNAQRAEIHLVLQGTVFSDTMGVTRQAAVNTLGKHAVVAIKPVMFDGRQISTRRPQIWVDVHNEHVAAQTMLDGLPIFGGIARGTALSTAERLRPQADAETADRLSAQVGPQFNQEADLQLARFNRLLKKDLLARFGEFWPTKVTTRTTDSHLFVSGSWSDTPNVSLPLVGLSNDLGREESITVRIHESVLNSALHRLPIAGKSFSEQELGKIFETFINQLGGKVLTPANSKTVTAVPFAPIVRFADRNAMRVSISAGQVSLVVNASIEVAGQTVLAQDEITVPLTWKTQQNAWQIDPGKLEFAKADQGISLVGMMESLARTQLANTIPTTLLPQGINLPSDVGPTSSLQVASLKATDGWLTLALTVESFQQRIPEESARPITIIRSQSPSRIERRDQDPPSLRIQPQPEPSSINRIESRSDRRFSTTTATQASSPKAAKRSTMNSRSSLNSKSARELRETRPTRDPAGWFD